MLAMINPTYALTGVVFAYAAYRDWKERRVPNWVWLAYLAVGTPLMLYQGIDTYWLWRSVLVITVAALIPYAFKQIGGADVKGMFALSVVLHQGGMAMYVVMVALLLALAFWLDRWVRSKLWQHERFRWLLRTPFKSSIPMEERLRFNLPFMVPMLLAVLMGMIQYSYLGVV